ncbi:MAG: trimethylamine methyltransferase family protein [Deltaproteobacteria bacterium]|nr:trimethylamine methyltransferase family protein [Deltaproteobacteria bacterium]
MSFPNTSPKKARLGSKDLYEQIHEDALMIIESLGVKASEKTAAKIIAALDPDRASALLYFKDAGRFYVSRDTVRMAIEQIQAGYDYWPKGCGTGGMAAYLVEGGQPRTATLDDIRRLAELVKKNDELTAIYSSVNPCSRIRRSDTARIIETECGIIDIMVKTLDDKFVNPTLRTKEAITHLAEYYHKGHKVAAALSLISTFLTISDEMVDPFIWVVQSGLPHLMNAMPIAGLTGPYTLTSLATYAQAEALFALTLAQLIKPGIKIINGAMPTIADVGQRDMPLRFGSRSNTLVNILLAELNTYLGLPTCQSACGHSRATLDDQARQESMNTYRLAKKYAFHQVRHLFGFAAQLNDFSLEALEEEILLYRQVRDEHQDFEDLPPAVYDEEGLEAITEGVTRSDFRNLDHTLKNLGHTFQD